MISFSPKARFLKKSEQVEAFQKLVTEPLIHVVLESALAEMAWRSPPESREQLIGVNNFISLFLNMGTPIEAPKPMPAKTLKSWDLPAVEMPPDKKKPN